MRNRNERGQSTIEFIFTFVFGVSIIFLIFNSAMNHATGYLVHYGTFMASRTYLTADSYRGNFGSSPNQFDSLFEQKAKDVFEQYNLSIFGINSSFFRVNHPDGIPQDYLTVGTYVLFDQRIDVIGRIAGQNRLELTSESYLGKEPTRFTCALQTCRGLTAGDTCDPTLDVTLFDNGC